MRTQKVMATQNFAFPLTCKCPECGAVSTYRLTIPARGEGTFDRNPIGRKQRAEQEAKENVRCCMVYHINRLYEECGSEPHKIVRYLDGKCPECGAALPWRGENGAGREAVAQIDEEYLPKPLLPKKEMIEMCGLTGVPEKPGLDAEEMHR